MTDPFRSASDSAANAAAAAGPESGTDVPADIAETAAPITLLVRQDCHLCEQAIEVVQQVALEQGASWQQTDVDADPELRAEYGDLVPVLLVDGREISHFTVDADELRAALHIG